MHLPSLNSVSSALADCPTGSNTPHPRHGRAVFPDIHDHNAGRLTGDIRVLGSAAQGRRRRTSVGNLASPPFLNNTSELRPETAIVFVFSCNRRTAILCGTN